MEELTINVNDWEACGVSSATVLDSIQANAESSMRAYLSTMQSIYDGESVLPFTATLPNGSVVDDVSLSRLRFVNPTLTVVSWPIWQDYDEHTVDANGLVSLMRSTSMSDTAFSHFPTSDAWASDVNQWYAICSTLQPGNSLIVSVTSIDGVPCTDLAVYRALMRFCSLSTGFQLGTGVEMTSVEDIIRGLRYDYASAFILSQLCQATFSKEIMTWADLSTKTKDFCGDDESVSSALSDWISTFSTNILSPDGSALVARVTDAYRLAKFDANLERLDLSDVEKINVASGAFSWNMLGKSFLTIAEYAVEALSFAGWLINPIVGAVAAAGSLAWKLGQVWYESGDVSVRGQVQEPYQLSEPIAASTTDAFRFRFNPKTGAITVMGSDYSETVKHILSKGILKIDYGAYNVYVGLCEWTRGEKISDGIVEGTARLRLAMYLKLPPSGVFINSNNYFSAHGMEYDASRRWYKSNLPDTPHPVTSEVSGVDRQLYKFSAVFEDDSGNAMTTVQANRRVCASSSAQSMQLTGDASLITKLTLLSVFRMLATYEMGDTRDTLNTSSHVFPPMVSYVNSRHGYMDALGRRSSYLSKNETAHTATWHFLDRAKDATTVSSSWSAADDNWLEEQIDLAILSPFDIVPRNWTHKQLRRVLAHPRVQFVADRILAAIPLYSLPLIEEVLLSDTSARSTDFFPFSFVPSLPEAGVDIPSDEEYQRRTTIAVAAAIIAVAATSAAVAGRRLRRRVSENLTMHQATLDKIGLEYASGACSADTYRNAIKAYNKQVRLAKWLGVSASGDGSGTAASVSGLFAYVPSAEEIQETYGSYSSAISDEIGNIREILTGDTSGDTALTPEQMQTQLFQRITSIEEILSRMNKLIVKSGQ